MLEFAIWKQTPSLVFLGLTGPLYSLFKKTAVKQPSMKRMTLRYLAFQIKIVLYEKNKQTATTHRQVQLVTHTCHSLGKQHVVGLFISSHETVDRYILRVNTRTSSETLRLKILFCFSGVCGTKND